MKSMCQDSRRSSPSVAARSPASSCLRTTSRMAPSSISRSSSALSRPAANSSRARSSSGRAQQAADVVGAERRPSGEARPWPRRSVAGCSDRRACVSSLPQIVHKIVNNLLALCRRARDKPGGYCPSYPAHRERRYRRWGAPTKSPAIGTAASPALGAGSQPARRKRRAASQPGARGGRPASPAQEAGGQPARRRERGSQPARRKGRATSQPPATVFPDVTSGYSGPASSAALMTSRPRSSTSADS